MTIIISALHALNPKNDTREDQKTCSHILYARFNMHLTYAILKGILKNANKISLTFIENRSHNSISSWRKKKFKKDKYCYDLGNGHFLNIVVNYQKTLLNHFDDDVLKIPKFPNTQKACSSLAWTRKCKHPQSKKKKRLRPFKAEEHSTVMTHIWVDTASIYNKTMLNHNNCTEKHRMK